ncbi:MAG: NUDIX domain-containing protein, partial [Chloroflexota bacterium]
MTTVQPSDEDRELLAGVGRGPDARSTDIDSGRGVPSWLETSLNYCSRCGTQLTLGPLPNEDRDRLACPSCGFVAYVNPRLVVTTLPITDHGEVVLLRRGIDPGRGSWAQPGGFLEVDETVTEAAVRETFEETGYVVQPGEIVGLYSRLEAAVVVIA